MGIEPVSVWRPHYSQAVYRSDLTGRPNHEVDLRNSHAAAISMDAVVASVVAMMIPKRAEDGGEASTFALWSSLVLGKHRIDQALVKADQRRSPRANVSGGLITAQHFSDCIATYSLLQRNSLMVSPLATRCRIRPHWTGSLCIGDLLYSVLPLAPQCARRKLPSLVPHLQSQVTHPLIMPRRCMTSWRKSAISQRHAA